MIKAALLNMSACFSFLLAWLLFAQTTIVCAGTIDQDKAEKFHLLEYLKGQPTEDQFFLGMYTYHVDPKSRRIRNWQPVTSG